jgi:17beta-estradiol 17-dehydrogenase / very-long-chain 3-oxoacyl-CoA reductase
MQKTAAVTGWATIVLIALAMLRFVYRFFLAPSSSIRRYAKDGKWAVVTGASDGIGKGFCFELARAGVRRIVLISRTASKLEAVATELKAKYESLETMVIPFDFAAAGDAQYSELQNKLASLDVSILVNNVGVNTELFYPLGQNNWTDVKAMLDVNIGATVRMTHMLVEKMAKAKCGLVLNLSSFTGVHPAPMMSIYSASKSFVNAFSDALHYEYADRGVTVRAYTPFYVVSSMSGFKRGTLMVPTAVQFARTALKSITCQPVVSSPYWVHGVLQNVLSWLPRGFVASRVRAQMVATTKRFLRKKEKLAGKSN